MSAGVNRGLVADFVNEQLELVPKTGVGCSKTIVPVVSVDPALAYPLSLTTNTSACIVGAFYTAVVPAGEIWLVTHIHVKNNGTGTVVGAGILSTSQGTAAVLETRASSAGSWTVHQGGEILMVAGDKFMLLGDGAGDSGTWSFYVFGKKYKTK